MNDWKSYVNVTEVTSKKGFRFECEPYLRHPQFSFNNELCAQLHYLFLHYVPNRSESKAREVRQALVLLLDFRQVYHERNPVALHLNSVGDLTSDVMRQFERYLQNEYKLGKSTVRPETPLARLRSALNYVAMYTGKIPSVQLPRIRYDRGSKTEPLDEGTFSELVSALKTHIDKVRLILENRIKVQGAVSYTFQELTNLVNPAVNCESLVRWFQYAIKNQTRKPAIGTLRKYLEKSDDPFLMSIRGLPTTDGQLMRAWLAYYEGDGKQFLMSEPINPFETNLSNLCLDEFRAMKTLVEHGYPLHMSIAELHRHGSRMQSSWNKKNGTVLECILPYYNSQRRGPIASRVSLEQLLNTYYPSIVDMVVVILFLMVQTGWNKETVIAIDSNNFEEKLSGLLVEDEITIFSEKNRSQGNQLPYFDPKLFRATSSKINKYSAYNLIKLAEALSEPFMSLPIDFISLGDDMRGLNLLFTALRAPGVWVQFGRFYPASSQSLFRTGVKEFLKLYPIHANGRRLTKAEDLTPALRPTWILMQRKVKPLSLVALLQGHDSTTTTDIYYDSSGLAMKERRSRLRGELEAIAGLLKKRKFSGLVGKTATTEQLRNGLTIFFLPGHDKGMWGCRNRFQPDWPGFAQRAIAGQKCMPSVNCIFCSQCYVFEDSLPYLIDRYAQIEAHLASSEESDFSSSLNAEHDVIEWLITNWGDDRAVQSAFAYQQEHTPLFPTDLAAFKVLFDDTDATQS